MTSTAYGSRRIAGQSETPAVAGVSREQRSSGMSNPAPNPAPLWTPKPDRVAATQVVAFMTEVNKRHGLALSSYRDLHAWTIAHPDLFWSLIWDTCGVIGEKGTRLVSDPGKMPGAKFLADARLNFAENLLRRSDDGEALVFRGEDKATARLTWRELSDRVSRLQQALKEAGVGVGDRVAAM